MRIYKSSHKSENGYDNIRERVNLWKYGQSLSALKYRNAENVKKKVKK